MSTEYGRLILRNVKTARRMDSQTDCRSVPWGRDGLDRFIHGPLSLCGWIGLPALIAAVLYWPQ